jgi:hypothetical protein
MVGGYPVRSYLRGWIVLFGSVTLLLTAGCGVNSTFVYKPAVPVTAGPKLPISMAVFPFKDGTEDFTKRGSVLNPESLYYNLAKAGIGGQITALTPDLWAKALADDMAASGIFKSVRFIYGPSELVNEDFYIDGTLKKATASGSWAMPNEFALALRALQKTDNRLVWEKEVSYSWKNTPAMYEGFGAMSIQCMVDRHHADVNRVLRGLFAEAREDLVRTLAHRSENRSGDAGRSPDASAGAARNEEFARDAIRVGTFAPPALESADQVIDRILLGN